MLVLRTEIRADAPVLLCDVPGCGWAWELAEVDGPAWDSLLEIANAELARHAAAEHGRPGLSWHLATSWTEQGAAPEEPERGGGPAWEPFAAFPSARAGVPGLEVVWRRPAGAPPIV